MSKHDDSFHQHVFNSYRMESNRFNSFETEPSAEDGGTSLEVTRCPSDDKIVYPVTGTSYAVNYNLSDSDWTPRSAVQRPSHFVLFAEPGAHYSINSEAPNNPPVTISTPDNAFDLPDLFWHRTRRVWNGGFGDGHAATIEVTTYMVETQNNFTYALDG